MQTKPFDLEAAKAGRPVVTRNGDAVRFLCFDRQHPNFPIITLVLNEHGEEEQYTYTLEGKYWSDGDNSERDLFMKVETKALYANLYPPNANGAGTALFHDTEHAAQSAAHIDCVAIAVPVEISVW